jgi:hypothetical protein
MENSRSWDRALSIDAMGIKLFGWSSSWSDSFEKEMSSFTKDVESFAEDNYYTPDLANLYSQADHYVWLWGPYRKRHSRQLNLRHGDKAVLVGHSVLPIIARLSSTSIIPGRYLLTKGEESDNTLVSGEIWKVTPEVLSQLDFNQSNTIACERELHTLRFAGEDVQCWVYFDKKRGLEVNPAIDSKFIGTYDMSFKTDPRKKYKVFYTRPEVLL